MKILTAAQMGEVDRLSGDVYGIPSILLMENAGRSVVEELARAVGNLKGRDVVICCGKGNNGGDGLVAARHLSTLGANVEVLILADPAHLAGDARTNWKIVSSLGLDTKIFPQPSEASSYLRMRAIPDVIVDALFGTGLTKPLGKDFEPIVDWINGAGSSAFVVSVDLPSGLCADASEVSGTAVRAKLTVTFTALKMALVMPPASDYAGRVQVAAIGSPDSLLANPAYSQNLIDEEIARRCVPPRIREGHKGNYGHVFVLAGSRGKSGAALMAGMAALRAGAGLVTLGLPSSLQHDVIGKFPELMTEFLPDTDEGTIAASALDQILTRVSEVDSLIAGPGMSGNESTVNLIREVVRLSPKPLVLDADGLNAVAADTRSLRNDHGQVMVITPHPGEMSRLLHLPIDEVQKARREIAASFAVKHDCVTVLKGAHTVVASPGGEIFINGSGNPGMATGGTGDILAGMVGRFLAFWHRRKAEGAFVDVAEHVAAAVFIHGLAGDLAAREKGMESLIATDLLSYLPEAFRRIQEYARS